MIAVRNAGLPACLSPRTTIRPAFGRVGLPACPAERSSAAPFARPEASS